jgi:chromosome segregation ATPase
VSEEKSIAERLAGLETQQGNIQSSLNELKTSMAEMARSIAAYMADSADFRARLLAVEQDLRDGRQRFKAHDVAIQAIQSKCDQNEGLRIDGKRHLEASAEQEKQVHGAVLTAGWAERLAWALLAAILGAIAYFR